MVLKSGIFPPLGACIMIGFQFGFNIFSASREKPSEKR